MYSSSSGSIEAIPYSFPWEGKDTALLVIDMQNDFCSPGGFGERLGNDIQPTRIIIPRIAKLLERFRGLGWSVIHTREGHLPDLSDCPANKRLRMQRGGAAIGERGPMGRLLVRGEFGHAIVPELSPLPEETVIDKPGKGAFTNTDLDKILRSDGISRLIVTGVTTHVCVHTTIREANDRGYECLLVTDATAAYEERDHEAAIRMTVQQGGIFGWASSTEAVLEGIPEPDELSRYPISE
jgi:nicotinamidase-related amidase